MDKETAGAIAMILNNPRIIEVLNQYADAEIKKLHEKMERTREFGDLRACQGGIDQLRLLKRIRDDAIAVMDVERKR